MNNFPDRVIVSWVGISVNDRKLLHCMHGWTRHAFLKMYALLFTLFFMNSPCLSLAWSSFTACMASSVTTINRYTKTILEFKHKRKNIEKNLKIKQKLLDLDSPDQVWDMYISSVPSTTEEFLDLSSNTRKLSNASIFLDINDLPDHQVEEYCWTAFWGG